MLAAMKPFKATVLTATLCSSLLVVATPTIVTDLKGRDDITGCTEITPSPTDAVCGQPGSLDLQTNFYVVNNQTIPNADTCRDFCLDMNSPLLENACNAFSHDSATNLCSFYGSPVDGHLNSDPNSTVSVTESTCFTCNQNCRLASTINLVHNPRFDISQTLIGPWGSGLPLSLVPYSGGGNAIVLRDMPRVSTISPGVQQYVSLCPVTDYQLTFDYKVVKTAAADKDSQAGIQVNAGDCSTLIRVLANDTYLGSWHTFTCSFHRVGDNTQGHLANTISFTAFNDGGAFITYLANFRVSRIDSPATAKTTGPSLLVNGGFETGNYNPWVVTTNMKTRTYGVVKPGLPKMPGVPSSQYKFKFFGIAPRDGYYQEASGGVELAQTIKSTIKRGKFYVATIQYRAFHSVRGATLNIGSQSFHDGGGQFPLHEGSNKTHVFSRIFTGSPDTIGKFSFDIGTLSEVLPPANLTVLLDNIDLRELA